MGITSIYSTIAIRSLRYLVSSIAWTTRMSQLSIGKYSVSRQFCKMKNLKSAIALHEQTHKSNCKHQNLTPGCTRSKERLEVEEDCTLYGVSIINLPSAETHGSVPCWKNVTCQEKGLSLIVKQTSYFEFEVCICLKAL